MIRVVVLLVFSGSLVAQVHAQEQPVVRVSVSPQTVNVGEPTTMRVTVLVPTWFARPPVYPAFELANAITRLPPNSSFPTSERIGNNTWSGIVRDYSVYPLLGANYRISAQVIKVSYANPGSDPITVDVEVPDIVIKGQVPPGAEALTPYIAGRNLTLSMQADGDRSGLAVGDAITVTYSAELDGLPAIFLPPLASDLVLPGVSVYADQPTVADGVKARRSETLTLVFEAGGEFEIPGVELKYWNTASESIETATAAGITLIVTGPPATSTQVDSASGIRWPMASGMLVAGLVILLIWLRGAPRVAHYFDEIARRRRQTEKYVFAQLEKAIASQDPKLVYEALLKWMERLEPGVDARSFARDYGDASLPLAIDGLSAQLYNNTGNKIDMVALGVALGEARKRFLRKRLRLGATALGPLNP